MTADRLGEMLAAVQGRAEVLLAAFEKAPPAQRASALLLEVRCARRCLVMVVWQAPGSRLVFLPPYKNSPARNQAESVPAARLKNTSDGDRRWLGRVMLLDEVLDVPEVAFPLRCDHNSGLVMAPALAEMLRGVTPGRPLRRVAPLL